MSGEKALVKQGEFSRDQVELIKRTICNGSTDDELRLFLQTAQRLGLDPFARQICAVRRRVEGRDVMVIQVTIDGLRVVAERTGRYTPGRATEYGYDEKHRLVTATAFVRKLVGGEWHEVGETAHWDEYVQTGRNGAGPVGQWGKMPHVMLAKCAESRALRRAFPAELSGVHTDAEMAQALNPEPSVPDAEVVEAANSWIAAIEAAKSISELQGLRNDPRRDGIPKDIEAAAHRAYLARHKWLTKQLAEAS